MEKREYLQKLGQRIAELRAEKGYTQIAFSELIGISRMQLHRIEKGETETGVDGIRLIAIALNVKPSELIDI